MKANKTQQRALLDMLHRLYEEIREVEAQWNIQGDAGDYRPRIEYFHDAVRAFTASNGEGTEGKGRLSVELLAYDIGMLRYIQAHPLPKSKDKGGKFSARTEVAHSVPRVAGDKTGLKPDASVKNKLAELYKSYAVMFSALLSAAADYNYQTRMNDCNTEIEELSDLIHRVADEGGPQAKGQVDVEELAEDIESPDLRDKLLASFKVGTLRKRMQADAALKALKETQKQGDKQAKDIEQAHFTFATGQLAIYEGAKEVIKKMAIKGLNIVGDFVENAVRDAQRGDKGR